MPNYTLECAKCGEQQTVFRTLAEHGNWPKHCRKSMAQVFLPHELIADLSPFCAPVVDIRTGKVAQITSRRHLREFERDNGVRQVGNDLPSQKKWVPLDSPRQELIRATREVLSRKR